MTFCFITVPLGSEKGDVHSVPVYVQRVNGLGLCKIIVDD